MFQRLNQNPPDEPLMIERIHHSGHSPPKGRSFAGSQRGNSSHRPKDEYSRRDRLAGEPYSNVTADLGHKEELDNEEVAGQTKLKMKYTQIEAELDSKRAGSRERTESTFGTNVERPSGTSYAHLRSKSHRITDITPK